MLKLMPLALLTLALTACGAAATTPDAAVPMEDGWAVHEGETEVNAYTVGDDTTHDDASRVR